MLDLHLLLLKAQLLVQQPRLLNIFAQELLLASAIVDYLHEALFGLIDLEMHASLSKQLVGLGLDLQTLLLKNVFDVELVIAYTTAVALELGDLFAHGKGPRLVPALRAELIAAELTDYRLGL